MNNNLNIFYNNVDIFSGLCPTPFVSADYDFIDYKSGQNLVTNLTMNGQLTGRYLGQLSYYELTSGFNLLLNRLSNNYGSLVISENSETLFSGQSVIIDSIETEDSTWYGVLPFSIKCIIYETGIFRNYFGVIEPEEKIEYSEEDGLIVNLNYSISAKGLNITGTSAIQNAKNWVHSRTGNYTRISPILVDTGIGSNFLLNSIKESIDRFNGTYGLDISYVKSTSQESPKTSLLDYTVDISSGINDNFITVGLQGSFKNNQISGGSINLRNDFLNYDFYNLANNISLNTFNTILNSNPISQSVTEEQNSNVLNFNISYNNDFISNVVNDYTVDISTDSLKNITNVNLNAKIFARYGDIDRRWLLVQDFYNNSFNAFAIANTEYIKEISNRILYSRPLTESITFNQYTAEIQYNASWSDKRVGYSDNVINMTSSVKYTPSVRIHVPNTSAFTARDHNIQNLNCANRTILDINVLAVAKPNKPISFAIEEVTKEINRIKLNYGLGSNSLLQNRNVTQNDTFKSYSINEIWGYEGGII